MDGFGSANGKQIHRLAVGGEMSPGSSGVPKIDLDLVCADAPTPIFAKDLAGRYVYVNKQHEVITGLSSEQTLGRTDSDLFPPALATAYRNDDLQTLKEMAPLRFEQPVTVQGRERLFAIVKFPVLRGLVAVAVCGIGVDITEDPHVPGEPHSRADAFFSRLLATLTPQEVRVLDLVAAGLSDREIAEKLSLSSDTVRHHVSHLLRKLRKRRGQVIIEMLKRDRL